MVEIGWLKNNGEVALTLDSVNAAIREVKRNDKKAIDIISAKTKNALSDRDMQLLRIGFSAGLDLLGNWIDTVREEVGI